MSALLFVRYFAPPFLSRHAEGETVNMSIKQFQLVSNSIIRAFFSKTNFGAGHWPMLSYSFIPENTIQLIMFVLTKKK